MWGSFESRAQHVVSVAHSGIPCVFIVLDARVPSHPRESIDSVGTPREALKPALRDPAPHRHASTMRCSRRHLALAPAVQAADTLRTSGTGHYSMGSPNWRLRVGSGAASSVSLSPRGAD